MLPTVTPTPPPTMTSLPAPVLTWVDIGGFWVGLVAAIATTAAVIVAIWLAVRSSRESAKNELRAERAEWVRSYADYLNGWVRHWADLVAIRVQYEQWYLGYDELLARAAVLRSSGAQLLLLEADYANREIETNEPDDEHLEAQDAREELIKWASEWVNDPSKRPGKIVEHINRFRPGGSEYETD